MIEIIYTLIILSLTVVTFWCVFSLSKNKKYTTGKLLAGMVLSGALYYSVTLSWILTAYPLSDIKLEGLGSTLLLISFYALTALVAGLSFAVFVSLRLFSLISSTSTLFKISKAVVFGLLVVVSGYLKSFLLFILYYAPNISFGWYWLFGDPSLSLVFTPFSHLYSYIGTDGVSFLFGVLLYLFFLLQKNMQKVFGMSLIALCILWLFLPSTNTFTLTDISEEQYITTLGQSFIVIPTTKSGIRTRQELVLDRILSLEDKKYIILTPESVGINDDISKEINKLDSTIIYEKGVLIDNKLYNSLFIKNIENTQSIKITEKKFLIPFGEYMPSFFKIVARLFISSSKIELLEMNRDYDSGFGLQEIKLDGEVYIVGLCSDFWSREGVSFAKNSKAKKALVFESNSFFHGNKWFLINLYAWHVMFAKTTHKDLISVPNDSPAWILKK